VPKHTVVTGTLGVHVRLPAIDTYAGLCFDVAGPHDYTGAFLMRGKDDVELLVQRYASGKWIPLGSKRVEVDPWRLDGWFPVEVDVGADGVTARGAGAEVKVPRARLGLPNATVGLIAGNSGESAVDMAVRAFRATVK
jgi:hypothetical protein